MAQVDKAHYAQDYDTKARFASYWHQIDEVQRFGSQSVLEVGVGSGVVHSYLRQMGIDVYSVDIAEDLVPDILGSITSLPFSDHSFGVGMACQVLEHLPWESLSAGLSELRRISSEGVIISVPNASKIHKLSLLTSKRGSLREKAGFSITRNRREQWAFNGQHYWEIGYPGFTVDAVLDECRQAGLSVIREYRVPENPYHHFFILSARQGER